MLSAGTASKSLQGGFSSTRNTLEDPGRILDGFFDHVAAVVKTASGPAREGDPPSPGVLLAQRYAAEHDATMAAFLTGWQSGLDTVRDLIEKKEGRRQMRGLTDQVAGQAGSENVRYSTLKANAMYLGSRAKGTGHEEAGKKAARYAALKLLSEFDPTSVRVPEDGHTWATARVPTNALSAALERIDALPEPLKITHIVPTGKRYTYDPVTFNAITGGRPRRQGRGGPAGQEVPGRLHQGRAHPQPGGRREIRGRDL